MHELRHLAARLVLYSSSARYVGRLGQSIVIELRRKEFFAPRVDFSN